jgi:hypothetical protein
MRLNRRGFALEATLILMVLMAALAAAAVMSAAMVTRTAGVDYRGTRVNYVAEAGADNVMAQLEVNMSDGIISNAELSAITAPTLPGFTITASAARIGGAVPMTINQGPYAGLIGLNQKIDITVTAVDALRNRADAVVGVNAQSIPLFQFGVFYENDLEIHNGPRMDFAGWVHTNGNLYLCDGGTGTYFQDIVTTPQSMFRNRKPVAATCNNVYIDNASGVATNLNFDSRSQPTAAGFTAQSNARFNGRLMTSAQNVTPLRLPLPTGMPPVQLIKPRAGGDSPEAQAVKMAWKSDYYITIDLTRVNGTPSSVCTQALAMVVQPAARAVPDAAKCPGIFQFRRNAFMDGREDRMVDVLDINVDSLHLWVAGSAARANSIMYVTFAGIDSSASPDQYRDYPAVRLYSARQLRFPWTFATDVPVYIRGNYNDIGWQPASILGDAITFLSSNWTDGSPHNAYNSGTYRTAASETWIYAAVAAGNSGTPCDYLISPCTIPSSPPPTGGSYPNYGGGLENFPRFLENWSGVQMHYRGSLVSLFEANYADRYRWAWRSYYDAPTRDWEFELRFRDPNQLPPGTPTAGTVNQIAFRPVY